MKVRNKVKAKMANTFKKIIKKHKKKKLQAERNRKAKARERAEEEYADDYERRLSRHKRSVVKKTVITVVAIAAAVTAVGFYIEKRSYHTYKVVQTSEQEDIVSTNYVEMDGNILRYSPDGVSLVSDKMSTLWSETYQMQNPVADVNGTHAVIADKDGTTLEIYDKSGKTGSVTTSYSIVKAKVSKSGLQIQQYQGDIPDHLSSSDSQQSYFHLYHKNQSTYHLRRSSILIITGL